VRSDRSRGFGRKEERERERERAEGGGEGERKRKYVYTRMKGRKRQQDNGEEGDFGRSSDAARKGAEETAARFKDVVLRAPPACPVG
jgi:hypothetical protein